MRTLIDIPTPDALDHDPELAVIAALEANLEAARFAVIAAQPGLRNPDPVAYPDDTHLVAGVLVTLISDLIEALGAYRAVLARQRARAISDSDDTPF